MGGPAETHIPERRRPHKLISLARLANSWDQFALSQ